MEGRAGGEGEMNYNSLCDLSLCAPTLPQTEPIHNTTIIESLPALLLFLAPSLPDPSLPLSLISRLASRLFKIQIQNYSS
jgi:hypothetical protein